MSSPIELLPAWALETMAACLRGADAPAFAREVEDARTLHLFDPAGGNEAWHGQFPIIQRVKPRDLTQPAEWLPVLPETLDCIFGEAGDLARLFPRYEPRVGQQKMAHAVAEALNQRRFLLAEAGTGVGKSLAYLVPAALWAGRNNLPIVISTNTRNLQSQLLTKDVPLVQKIVANHLPRETPLTAVVLKGRANYLCLKRFGAAVESGFEAFNTEEALTFAELVAWAATTKDGDLDAFRPRYARADFNFVHSFGCRADECTGKRCRFYRRCFLLRARQAALQAHLIIANHALVFAELTNPGSLLPPHAQIIFDEAHNLENAATDFFSGHLSPHTLYDLCQRLAPSKGREAGTLSQQVRKTFIDDYVPNPAEQEEVVACLAEIRQCGVTLAKVGRSLFETLFAFIGDRADGTVRFRVLPDATKPPLKDGQAQLRREVCLDGRTFIPAEEVVPEAEITRGCDAIHRQLSNANLNLERLLGRIARVVDTLSGENHLGDLVAMIESLQEGLQTFGQMLDDILAGRDPEVVYWMARVPTMERTVALTAAPLDISRQLAKLLYESKETLVFSSATLRILNRTEKRSSFSHFCKRLGLHLVKPAERLTEFVAESPFDYPHQCAVVVPSFLPEVATEGNYQLELARLMYQLFVTAQGRSLALFTSYEMLTRCAELLAPHLKAKGIDLLVQSSALGRDAMTEAFRAQTRPTVLFGTQSFWEGVDVVGDALSCVVIARLPFESVGDPLFKARCEKIERESKGMSFVELSLPQAVIRFRQGFGRLIRSRSDRGMVVVADARIVKKSYGRTFADSLPVKVEVCDSRPKLCARLQTLLSNGKCRKPQVEPGE